MARLRPPQHPVDETEVGYICESDDAWDHDLIKAEASKMTEPDDHPVRRYWAAHNRASLESSHTFAMVVGDDEIETKAASAGDYLDFAKNPERWYLRRIDELDYIRRVVPHLVRGEIGLAHEAAVRLALVRCEGGPKLERAKDASEATDNDVRTVIREGIIGELGQVAIHMSRPLTNAEKKQSAS